MRGVSPDLSRGDAGWSGCSRHVGGQDVVRVAVEVGAGPVVAHRGARVGVAGGDLDVPEVHASIEHRGDPRVAEHMRVCPCPQPGAASEAPKAAGGAWRSIRVPRLLSRIGPWSRGPVARSIARLTAGGSGTWGTLLPFPHTRSTRWPCSSPRSVMFALVASKIRRPSRPSMATKAKSDGLADSLAAVSRASNCKWVHPREGDWEGECCIRPSITQVQ